jgi:hypothetical protein
MQSAGFGISKNLLQAIGDFQIFYNLSRRVTPDELGIYDQTPQGFIPTDSSSGSNAYFSGGGGLMSTAEQCGFS